MQTDKIMGILLLAVPLLFSLSFHEAAHAYLAFKRGDPTAKELGRMTLNPIPHIDPIWTILVPIIFYFSSGMLFGGAKPVPVNPVNLRNYKKDNLLISIAGPVSNLILAACFAITIKIMYSIAPEDVRGYYFTSRSLMDYPFIAMLDMGVMLNITLALFNMIPIYPLDGSHVLEGILPDKYSEFMNKYQHLSFIVFILLIFTGIISVLYYPITFLYRILIGFAL